MRYMVQTVANGTPTNNMHVFRGKIEDLLGMLGAEDPNAQTQQIPAPDVSDPFQMFKQFVHDYVQEHDELPEDHPIIQQIHNFNTVDEIEKILSKNGNTEVKIKIKDEKNKYIINLKNKRFVDRKSLNLLKNQGISTNIL